MARAPRGGITPGPGQVCAWEPRDGAAVGRAGEAWPRTPAPGPAAAFLVATMRDPRVPFSRGWTGKPHSEAE